MPSNVLLYTIFLRHAHKEFKTEPSNMKMMHIHPNMLEYVDNVILCIIKNTGKAFYVILRMCIKILGNYYFEL